MKIKRYLQTLSITFFIVFILALTFSCETKTNPTEFSHLELGEIRMTATLDTGDCNNCLHFTTASETVAEPKGGIIRIDEPTGDCVGTIVMYSGGLGNWYISRREKGANFISDLTKEGFRVIQIKWDKGWFIGRSGNYEGFKNLAVHPATVTQYIYDELADKGKPFVLFGGSGGAAQIAYMLSFYGIDKITNSAIVFGGFWMGRLDLGCFDKDSLNYYMHYSDRAKASIDLSFGFDSESKGPCELYDTNYVDLYKNNSVSIGGNYYYPGTHVYLIYGGNDRVGALNQGLTYYSALVTAKSPFVHMQVIDGAPHGILYDSTGYDVLQNIILKQIANETIANTTI
ncbi:MAG: hypothetical protein HKN87_23395 [Saprospiraceae bacterium]|nr:hypothetical protein [Saprospiraceae bacterium]